MRNFFNEVWTIDCNHPQQGTESKNDANYVPVESAQFAADMVNVGIVAKSVERAQCPSVANEHNLSICGALYLKFLQKQGLHKRSGKMARLKEPHT